MIPTEVPNLVAGEDRPPASGARVDKIRPDDPNCSATITYDLPLNRNGRAASRLAESATAAVAALDTTLSILSNENSEEAPKP